MHAIEAQGQSYDYVLLLQPTSPLRTAQHIDEAIELLFEKNANAVISVCETDHSPLWVNTLPEDGNMGNFIREEVKGKRSQDLPTYYRLNGAIYIADTESVVKEKSFYPEKTYSYVMEKSFSIDVDDAFDFKLLEVMLSSAEDK